MLWLALHLPWLPLEALCLPVASAYRPAAASAEQGDGATTSDPATPTASLAVCVIEQRVVCVTDAAAQAAGISPGMAAATASALCPGLTLLERDRPREAACLHLLALALSRFTPHLVLQPQGVWLELESTLRLFGGLRGLAQQIGRVLQQQGLRARAGLAPTGAAAGLFAQVPGARGRPGRARALADACALLDALPLPPVLEVLQASARLAGLLQGIGCHTVGAVRALPRNGLQRRGAGALLQQLDAAYGEAPDPHTWFVPPLQFELALELQQRADDAAMLGFAAQRLVQALAGWLSSQWLAVSAFSLWLQHETTGRHARPPTQVRIELGQASRDAHQLGQLLRERLQRFELPDAVYGLKLVADDTAALAGHAGRLPFGSAGGAAAPEDFQALLDRLSARLGKTCVQRLQLRADHRPERAAVAVPAIDASATASPVEMRPTGPRPAWLLPAPLRLAEQGGRPVHGGALVLRTAAERIEAGWFDGALVCRDYHVAEGADHRLRWVFRERQGDQLQWYLHGFFA